MAVPLLVLLAAPRDDLGAERLLERAVETAAWRPVEVILAGQGLGWRGDPRLLEASRTDGLTIAVCSADARQHGWTLESTPPHVAWSSLVGWLRSVEPDQPVWAAL